MAVVDSDEAFFRVDRPEEYIKYKGKVVGLF